MPVILGQLVCTSFPEVGLRTLASTQVPRSIQQAFIQQVVHQYWDSYNPPSFGYQAVYIRQLTLEHTLFGWLYNDGLDDLGRSNVPYFVCYYLAEQLDAVQLENIFTCLHRGPAALIERQQLPPSLETLIIPDWYSYKPAGFGVAIPSTMREQSRIALQYRRLINLFISADKQERVDWLEQYKQQAPVQSFVAATVPQALPYGQDDDLITQGDRAEPLKSPLLIGIGIGFASTLAIASGSYFFLQLFAAPQVQRYPVSPALKNTAVRNISLANTVTGHSDVVWSVTISRDSQTLLSSSGDKTIKLWHLPSGELQRTLSAHSGKVWSIAISPDGQTLASGSSDNTIKLWSLPSGELRRTLSGHSAAVRSVAISPDGQTLASGSSDNTIKLWNLPSGELLHTLFGHQDRVISVAFSPGKQLLASGSVDRTIKIWNPISGKLQRTLSEHSDWVNAVAISPDGRTLASGIGDIIKVWNLNTGELLQILSGHSSDITSLCFSINGKILISGSGDKTIKVWQL
jgi:predicted NACHT family NTPase